MANFHRLSVPGYFGGLPAGYDYINNALSGTPANANGALTYGPNIGSYYVGFGDDGTSANANRPNNALAQNTDYLDNLLHQDIAIPVLSATAAGGPGVTSLVLPANTFLGVAGTTNTQAGLLPYFHITDDSNNDIIDPTTGLPVQVASLTLTGGDTIGNGFSTNTVTAVFTEAIPTGRNYRIYYATRSQLANLPQDAFINIRIRAAQEVPEETENLFRELHGNSLAWDAAWTSTIWDLSLSGLDERYKRATVADSSVPAGWPVAITNDTAGSGAWYTRTGPGLTGYSAQSVTGGTYTLGVGWMAGALFAALDRDTGATVATPLAGTRYGGETTGFYYLGGQRYTGSDIESTTLAAPGFASIFHGSAVEVNPAGPSTNFKTWLPAGTTVTFTNPNTISVLAPAFFAHTFILHESAIAFGYDLLELDFGDGKKHQYVFSSYTNTTTVTLSNKDGSTPSVTTGTTATVVRWIRMNMAMFDGAAAFRHALVGSAGVLQDCFVVADPPDMLSSGTNVEPIGDGATGYFFSNQQDPSITALAWGGYDDTAHTYVATGFLTSDGGANFGAGIIVNGNISGDTITAQTNFQTVGWVAAGSLLASTISSTGGTSPFSLDLFVSQSLQIINPSGSGALAVNVTDCPTGAEFSFSIRQTAANFSTVAVTCDGGITVHFEPATLDATLGGANCTDVYRGLIIGTNCFMSVQRFPGV